MPPWPFFSSTSVDASTPPTRDPTSLDRSTLTPQLADNDPFSPSPLAPEIPISSSTSPAASPRRPHASSFSNTLPAIFGGTRKRPPPIDGSLSKSSPGLNNAHSQSPGSPKKHSAKGRGEEGDFEVGKCATCDSKAKWPKGVSEYRCGTCLMINDLKVAQQDPRRLEEKEILPSTSARDHGRTGCQNGR